MYELRYTYRGPYSHVQLALGMYENGPWRGTIVHYGYITLDEEAITASRNSSGAFYKLK